MDSWIACGDAFIKADVIRWKEAIFDGPFTRRGKRAKRGKPVRVGEREVIAEVLTDPDAKGYVELLIRGCVVLSSTGPKEIPPMKAGAPAKRQTKTLTKLKLERLQWSDESAREAVIKSQEANFY